MKERLEQLTMGQFIDLACGKVDVILSKSEITTADRKTLTVRNLIFEYKEIVDPAGAKQYLSIIEDMMKARIEVVLFTMCSNLVDLNEHERVREVMMVYGINARTMNTQRVAAEVTSRLERAKSKVTEIQNDRDVDTHTSEKIRRQFDEQTATLMAYFKFQIDLTSIKATVYAHLVARHNREIKAKLAALKKM